ncbi:MAG: sugar transferase [Chloroflexi bacterium]|nr:sugar transferase [Chloroflexota bacterium]
MNVLILATDEQRTLSPLSDTLPGPMIPVVDRPVMATSIEILARAGQKQILVSLFERGGQIATYFGNGQRWGVDIRYLTQRQALGSAGALRFAGNSFTSTMLVLPGEALVDLDVAEALAFHRAHGGIATAIVHAPFPGSRAPLVGVAPDGRLLGSAGDVPAAHAHLTGAYILEPAVLQHLPRHGASDIAQDLLPAIRASGELVYGYRMHGYWNPMDSLAAFQDAQEVYLTSAFRACAPDLMPDEGRAVVRYPSIEARQIAPGIWGDHNHAIHPSAKLTPPIYVGSNSWVGREVELGPLAVIGASVMVDDEATVVQSTVLANTYLGRLVYARRRILNADTISDPQEDVTVRVVDPFLLGPIGATASTRGVFRRLVSLLAALLLIIVLSPLLVLLGVLASFGSAGRPITRSPRVGQRLPGQSEPLTFQLLQFQTRRPGGEYTPFGRWLESWALQHLPALFNVLAGDMALVGVKPLRPDEYASLREAWHQRRHESPAGCTGLWYLRTNGNSDLDTVIVTDVYYTATQSWYNDLRILLRTPGAWLRRCSHHNPPERPSEEPDYPFQLERIRKMYTD